MAIELISNDITTTLAAAIATAGATSITVVSASGFPTTGNFRIRIDDEILLVTAVAGTTWTVERGVEDTTAATHLIAAEVAQVLTKQGLGNLAARARANVLINGAFNVWQRGTSFASIADATYVADRWAYFKQGVVVHDLSRSTDVPTVAQAGVLANYSVLIDCITVDASIAAGDYSLLVTYVEGSDFLALAQRPFVLSFWVKATKTGTYCVAFRNRGSDRTYVAEYTVSAADTWEKKTIRVPASPSAGTWNYTNGLGLSVIFPLANGSTFQTAAGSWTTGNFHSSANQVNATDDVANNFRLALVKLEPGDVATEFVPESPAVEMARCQRYYEVHGGTLNGVPCIEGNGGAGVPESVPVMFQVAKGGVPTTTKNGSWSAANCGQPAVYDPTTHGYRFQVTPTAGGAFFVTPDSADDTITAEWNPA